MFPVLLLGALGVGAYLIMNRDDKPSQGPRTGPTRLTPAVMPTLPFDTVKHGIGDRVGVHVGTSDGRDGFVGVVVTEAFDNAPDGPILDVAYRGTIIPGGILARQADEVEVAAIVNIAGDIVGLAPAGNAIEFNQQSIAPKAVIDLIRKAVTAT